MIKNAYKGILLFVAIVATDHVAHAQAAPACLYSFQHSLQIGSISPDVAELQKFLNLSMDTQVVVAGEGSPGMESNTYGPATAAAVKKFQEKYRSIILLPMGLKTGNGIFGDLTRARANLLCARMNQHRSRQVSESSLPGLVAGATTVMSLQSRVQVTQTVRVRKTPGLTGRLVGLEPALAMGTVIGGPKKVHTMTWWKVLFDNGLSGWSVQNYLLAGADGNIDATPTPASANDSSVSQGDGKLQDTVGNTWALGTGGEVLKNGMPIRTNEFAAVNLVLLHNGAVFSRSAGMGPTQWFMWTGSTWTSVDKDPREVSATTSAVLISSMSPSAGSIGTPVVIKGSGFGFKPTVHFGAGVIPNISSDGNVLTFTVPSSLEAGCRLSTPPCMILSQQTQLGQYDVSVKNGDMQSAIVAFTVTAE